MLEGPVQTYPYLGDEEAKGKDAKAPANTGGK
jgi:hypothetical protein